MTPISRERAERIARAHACENCGEYSYKKLTVKPALESVRSALKVAWQIDLVCGVCGMDQQMGIDDDGEIVFVG